MTRRSAPALLAALTIALLAGAPSAVAQSLPCAPCAGVRVDGAEQAEETAGSLARAAGEAGDETEHEAVFFIAWTTGLSGAAPSGGGGDAVSAHDAASGSTAAAAGEAARRVRAAGATPWITLRFTTPAPVPEHADELAAEIAAASRVVRAAGDAWYQVAWEPPDATPGDDPAGYAYLLKRAAVAVSGATASPRVVSHTLPADPTAVAAIYEHEVAGYLEAVAVAPAPAERLSAVAAELARLDPGTHLVVDALAWPDPPARTLVGAAETAVAGAQLTLFDATDRPAARRPEALAPLVLLTREFAGDLSHDPYSSPAGGSGWSFVRGSDLGLRVIVPVPPRADGSPADEVTVTFPDPQLRDPEWVRLEGGEAVRLGAVRRTADALRVTVADPGPVLVLRLRRAGVEELGEVAGVAEELTVASERQVPVEEILRRLQAFEDAQERRIEHYRATNTTHLRFGVGAGATGGFEATFQGPFFFAPGEGTDWAWDTLYVNGVRWRGKTIPEIPLVQPEKAAALPGEITFDKTYRYRLRGTEVVEGRDCWVVEFEPAVAVEAAASGGDGRAADVGDAGSADAPSLYRGTVWVDRQVHARVRTRAVQLGLEGDVLSNEETLLYRPVDREGGAVDWSEPGAFVLPLRIVAQQLLSVLNATTLVERETVLSDLTINGDDFAERRARVLASDVTMVRDTEEGLRYLVKDDDGQRTVKEGFDTDKWFLAAGTFWDDSLEYPIPLGGVNYLDLDFRGFGGEEESAEGATAGRLSDGGGQLNVFFAGALLTANLAQPRLFGSRFDAGLDAFAIGVARSDSIYDDGEERLGEEVEERLGSVAFKLGRPLGSFFKLSGEYRLRYRQFGSTDDTADGFRVPSDHLEHVLRLSGRYVRSGYSLIGRVGWSKRSEWEPWGFAGNPGYSPDHEDFLYWRLGLGKSWYLPGFRKIGAEVVYVDGRDLDRFSKYGFGFFGDTRVHGYRSGRVRAERAVVTHASYGFEIGQLLRLDAQADVAWASDEASGLEEELLAGVGLAGTFVGPWQTVVNLDVGTPVAGPDDGVVAYVVFLKLFD